MAPVAVFGSYFDRFERVAMAGKLKFSGHLYCRAVPSFWDLLQGPHHNCVYLLRNFGVDAEHRSRRFRGMLDHDGRSGIIGEWKFTRKHLVKDYSERIDVT